VFEQSERKGQHMSIASLVLSLVGYRRKANLYRTALPLISSGSVSFPGMGFGAALGALGNYGYEVIPRQRFCLGASFHDWTVLACQVSQTPANIIGGNA
jgi:hypothetical protein